MLDPALPQQVAIAAGVGEGGHTVALSPWFTGDAGARHPAPEGRGIQKAKTSPGNGGVVLGATRAPLACSYACAISINLDSENGLPRNSIAIGRPAAVMPAGRTIAGKPSHRADVVVSHAVV